MSITVVPTLTPKPRFALSISSSNGSTITAVSLTRTVAGATAAVRVQPSAGPSPRTVNDYEADWDTGVVYTATVTSSAGVETFVSNANYLSPGVPWAIHPTTPALSLPLDQAATGVMGVREHGQVARDASDTPHNVLGSRYRVYTKTSPRSASTTQLSITTVTADEAQAVLALVDDLTPVLIRVPAAWGWQWENGYYRVGQVTTDRQIQYGADQRRTFTLPLERVDSPAGTQQADRTWANVLSGFGSWSAERAAYSSWTNVLTDTRS